MMLKAMFLALGQTFLTGPENLRIYCFYFSHSNPKTSLRLVSDLEGQGLTMCSWYL